MQVWQDDIDADMAFHGFRDHACLRVQLFSAGEDGGDNMPSLVVEREEHGEGSPSHRDWFGSGSIYPWYKRAFRALTHALISRLKDLRLERAMAAISSTWLVGRSHPCLGLRAGNATSALASVPWDFQANGHNIPHARKGVRPD